MLKFLQRFNNMHGHSVSKICLYPETMKVKYLICTLIRHTSFEQEQQQCAFELPRLQESVTFLLLCGFFLSPLFLQIQNNDEGVFYSR